MKYADFLKNISGINAPVVLLEGKRKVHEEDCNKLIRLGSKLMAVKTRSGIIITK